MVLPRLLIWEILLTVAKVLTFRLAWAKDNYYDRLKDMGIQVHTIVGNHTAYYKNTNEVNAVDLLLREYDNVVVYSEPEEILLDKLKVLFIPWINKENEESTTKLIQDSTCKVAMGHLELNGFRLIEELHHGSWSCERVIFKVHQSLQRALPH